MQNQYIIFKTLRHWIKIVVLDVFAIKPYGFDVFLQLKKLISQLNRREETDKQGFCLRLFVC